MPKLNIDMTQVVKYLRNNAGQKSVTAMSVEIGYSTSFLTKVAKSQGIEISLTKIRSRYNVDQLKERLQSGMSINAAARELGMCFNAAWYHIRKANISDHKPEPIVKKERSMVNSKGFFNPHARENWLV